MGKLDEFKEWMSSNRRDTSLDLNRSQYSLVSCTDLTPEAVEIWLGLPEEVKYDPALAAFRRLYEREHGNLDSALNDTNPSTKSRLPLVSSAPHLQNNLHGFSREERKKSYASNIIGGIELPFWKKEETIPESETAIEDRQSRVRRAGHLVKLTLLIGCWIFFTMMFLLHNEKVEVTRQSSLMPGEVKDYKIHTTHTDLSIMIELKGPFLSEQGEMKLNDSTKNEAHKIKVWLEKIHVDGNRTEGRIVDVLQATDIWTIYLDEEEIDFSIAESRSHRLTFDRNTVNDSAAVSEYAVKIKGTAATTVPFSMTYTLHPLDRNTGVIYACVLLFCLYVLIIFEIINRTMAAVLVSTTSLAVLSMVGERPSLEVIMSWLDVETLLLLFSMMVLVAIMTETGLFDYLAVFTFEVTKGKMWPLIILLCFITALLSTFLDNVTTVLLMTPVTIRLCEVMDLDPVPILMSMVLYSNIGGTATPVGDPPNVIIASNKAVLLGGINFAGFTMHMTMGILLVCVQTYFQLRFIYRDTNKLRLKVPKDIQELKNQINIWRRAAESLPHLSKDEMVVRERLDHKIQKLSVQLQDKIKESDKRACPKDTFQTTLDEMKAKYKIRNKSLLVKASVAITFVVAIFFLHSIPELGRVSLAWTALLGAILLLILADREDLEPILHRVEWSTLLFFAALFILMESLSVLGLIEFIGGMTESIILSVNENARLAVALLLILWVSGITSAFVDNIPLTTMMIKIVTSLGSNPNLNMPLAPLIWALSFGACLGGNGTLIGASANVVCAGVAEQHGYKMTFMSFFKIGFPVMIGHLIVASMYLLFCHCLLTWH